MALPTQTLPSQEGRAKGCREALPHNDSVGEGLGGGAFHHAIRSPRFGRALYSSQSPGASSQSLAGSSPQHGAQASRLVAAALALLTWLATSRLT